MSLAESVLFHGNSWELATLLFREQLEAALLIADLIKENLPFVYV